VAIFELRRLVGIARDIRRAGAGGPDAVTLRQRRRLAEIVAFARFRSRLYRSLYEGLPPTVDDPRVLPPVTKGLLLEDFDGWVTDPAVTLAGAQVFAAERALAGDLYLGRYAVWTTSGTTGRPALFVHERDALAVYLALSAVRQIPSLASIRTVGKIVRMGRRTATVVAAGGPYASAVIETIARRHFPRLARGSRLFSITAPLAEIVAALNRFRPAVLGGYPTALAVLAGELEAGRLAIRPAVVFTGAEQLTAAARERIGAAFGCPVRDTYAASEFVGIAFECAAGQLHVNADWVILEPVDDAFRPVPAGRPSYTALLTNLANRVQPIIRYDMGDSVTAVEGPCPCGSPLPGVLVEGRRDETLFFRTPGGDTIPLLPGAVATAIEEVPGVVTLQAIQTGPACVTLRIGPAPGTDAAAVRAAAAARLRALLEAQSLEHVTIEPSDEPPRRDPGGGKMRNVFAASAPAGAEAEDDGHTLDFQGSEGPSDR
jgi:phenylacetate-CoA ligase